MYGVIKFLWSIPAYHQNLVAIGDEVLLYLLIICHYYYQVDMVQSSVVTPLFLRFMNMMINDATLQLDEGLQVNNNQIQAQIIFCYFNRICL